MADPSGEPDQGSPNDGSPGPASGSTLRIVEIGGIPIEAITYEHALSVFLGAGAAGRKLAVHFCTAHTIVEARDDERLRAALRNGGFNVADGMPLVWVGRSRGRRIERVCGLDVLPDVADRGRAQGARHFFYGGGEGAAERLAARLSDRFPGLIVAGIEVPPFRPLTADEDEAVVARLNAARADYVWVGLGTPKQDFWLADHRDLLEAPALMAVGAAFDIVAGRRRRAPRVMRRTGLEWLFRLALEPRRLLRRYTIANVRFIAIVLRDARHRRPRRAGRSGG
jgi:N-acetylglucosaminyldiphosphoundecaprenol N-acetyl-beta-D-mannosaminyltransferase